MKTILITVSGMSPAIITETLWALSRESPPVVPDEVVVITTLKGESDIERQLKAPGEAWGGRSVWDGLRSQIFSRCGLPAKSRKLLLSVRVIELADPASGIRAKAEDVRTPSDNADAADFILQTVSPFVDSVDQSVIASIAGGRKTMGALLYAAMSLIGRETDRVTHVLVSEPFDMCRGFFYPDQPAQALQAGPPGKEVAVTAADAIIDLADVPFVPLRNGFADLGEPRRSFEGLVQRYSREIMKFAGPPRIQVDAGNGTFVVNGKEIRIPVGRVSLLARFLWEHAEAGGEPFVDRNMAADHWNPWLKAWKRKNGILAAKMALKQDMEEGDVSNGLAYLRQALKRHHLEAYIPYLAPERSRIGFDLHSPDQKAG